MRQQKRGSEELMECEFELTDEDIEKIVQLVLQRVIETLAKPQGCEHEDAHG